MCQNKKCICPNSKMKSYGIRLMPFLTVRRFCRLPSNKIILDQLCPNFKKKLVVLISKCICPNRKCICPNRKIKSSALSGCQTVVPGKKILDQLTSVGCCRRMRLQEISRGKYQKYNWTKWNTKKQNWTNLKKNWTLWAQQCSVWVIVRALPPNSIFIAYSTMPLYNMYIILVRLIE